MKYSLAYIFLICFVGQIGKVKMVMARLNNDKRGFLVDRKNQQIKL